LQRPHASDPVGEVSAEPAPDRRGQQCDGSGEPRRAGVDFPKRDDGADHERIDHEVHAVERPTGRAGPERPPLRQGHVAIEGEKAGILDGSGFNGAGRFDFAHDGRFLKNDATSFCWFAIGSPVPPI